MHLFFLKLLISKVYIYQIKAQNVGAIKKFLYNFIEMLSNLKTINIF